MVTYTTPKIYDRKSVIPGAMVGGVNDSIQYLPVVCKEGDTKEIHTIGLPGTVDNEAAYTFSVDGTNISFTTDASATTGELSAGLVAAFEANATVMALGTIEASGTDLLITSKSSAPLSIVLESNEATTNDMTLERTVNPYLHVYQVVCPATVDNATKYSLEVGDVVIEYTTDANATTTELRDGLYTAFLNHPQAQQVCYIKKGSDRLLFYGKSPYETFTVTDLLAATTTNDLTVSLEVSAPTDSSIIPFGTFVALADNEGETVKLPAATTDTIFGIAGMSRAFERIGYVNAALQTDYREGYTFNDNFDCIADTGQSMGWWMLCLDSDMGMTDSVYVSVANGTQGHVTKNSSGTIDLSGTATKAKVTKPAQYSKAFGKWVVGIAFVR